MCSNANNYANRICLNVLRLAGFTYNLVNRLGECKRIIYPFAKEARHAAFG